MMIHQKVSLDLRISIVRNHVGSGIKFMAFANGPTSGPVVTPHNDHLIVSSLADGKENWDGWYG